MPIPSTDSVKDWSADGKWLLTVAERGEGYGVDWNLHVISPDGSDQRQVTTHPSNFYPRFAPDCRQIVYKHANPKSLRVINVDGSNDHEVLRAERLPEKKRIAMPEGDACWSPDGRRLAAVMVNLEVDEQGRAFLSAGDLEADCRLLIMDADGSGSNRRELRLRGLKAIGLGRPSWL
jgi:Tol biopolymer transport system component